MTTPTTPVAFAPVYRDLDLKVDHELLARRRAARLVARTAASDGEEGSTSDADADEDAELGPIPVAMSSETPVLRYDYSTGVQYYEVLAHTPASVDLTYCADGMPLVMSHRSWDGGSQHGLVVNVAVDGERTLRGDVLMSRAERSQEIADDIVRGIRRKVSVGYIVGQDYEQESPSDPNGIPTRRYTAWMPIELSVVPVPADYAGAGFGRSAMGDGAELSPQLREAISRFQQRHPTSPMAAHAKERTTMETPVPAAAPAAPAPDTRVNDISTMAERHGFTERLPEWLRAGKSALEVSQEINQALAERMQKPIQQVRGIELDPKEKRQFSFARAVILGTELEREFSGDLGFEKEIAQEVRKQMPATSGKAQSVLPYLVDVAGRAGVDSGTATTGGVFKFTQPGSFIEMLRNKTAVMRLGATVLPGLTGPVTFPKQNGAATAYWVGENPGADTTDSNLTTTTVSLAFKSIQATTSVSRQALFSAASGNYALDAMIMRDLAAVIGLAIDLAAINGLGSSNQPLGVLQNTSISAVTALGANGGTMAWGNWIDLETAIGDANADGLGTLGYLTNTKQRGVAKKSGVLGNTNSGIPVWTNAAGEMDGMVNGYRAVASNQVPRNLTKGTSTTVCSAVIFGAWDQLLIGQFGAGFETLVDPFRLKKQNMIEITAWNFVDVALRYPEAFAAYKD